MRRNIMRAAVLVALSLGAVAVPGVARAAPPGNDDFANATVISSSPFSDSVVIDDATFESGEPSGCYFAGKSIWYSITPASDGVIRADIGASNFYDRILYVYRQDGSGFGGLSTVACASPYYNGQSSATFTAQAGKTYYIQVGGFYSFSTGTLSLSVQSIPPPANDDFGNAKPVSSIPFQDDVDTTGATIQAGEPTLCTPPASEKTAWYAYTPASSGSVTARIPIAPAPTGIAVYTGSVLSGLTQLGCQYGFPLTIHVDAGTTYYFQIGTFGQYGGQLRFTLEVPPPPVANFSFYPGDPSTFEMVQFCDNSFDPVQAGISEAWDLGDGSTGTGYCVFHRFTKDGDYNVALTITTTDGRTASKSLVFPVRTHDVAITSVAVPSKGRVGRSSPISIGVSNLRYAETVQVSLFKSIPGGYQLVGTLTQSIPVTGKKKTIPFSFDYAFTSDDATVGKVTFQAVATIVNARDAIPADNTLNSLPVPVTQ